MRRPTNPGAQHGSPPAGPGRLASARSASTSPGSIGPAIGGLLIARIGVAAVFGLNTATFVLYAVVLACHPRAGRDAPQSSERFIPGLRAGGRYARHAPIVQRMLLRAALFLLPGGARCGRCCR